MFIGIVAILFLLGFIEINVISCIKISVIAYACPVYFNLEIVTECALIKDAALNIYQKSISVFRFLELECKINNHINRLI